MFTTFRTCARSPFSVGAICLLLLAALIVGSVFVFSNWLAHPPPVEKKPTTLGDEPRKPLDTSGIASIMSVLKWSPDATLDDLGNLWRDAGHRNIKALDKMLLGAPSAHDQFRLLLAKAVLYNYEGDPQRAYDVLQQLRHLTGANTVLAREWRATVIFYQGLSGLRLGENENCVMCRGESSCILPIAQEAIHANPKGSRLAIAHFTEYLQQFPEDLEVRWLLNIAHMTLGEHPHKVDARYFIALDHYYRSEFDIGRFREIGDQVGVHRLNWAGGAIMEDFDNDGLLDIVVTSSDPAQAMAYFRNKGDGTFEDRTEAAGLAKQFGGLNCVQTDYNNDGTMDIFIPRGGWWAYPMRPTLLKNNGDGTFTDVTREAGLLDPTNSASAQWADFDNDGFLDLFIGNETGANRLYRNKGDGTFEEVAAKAGVQGTGKMCKGCAWIDFDNDGYPDLFLNYWEGTAQLFRNNRNGTFTDCTRPMGINGPQKGFSCWAWDFDNDGFLDIFATSFDRTLEDVVKGLLALPHARHPNKLYRNLGGKGFQDVTREAGLDGCFAPMGSNFGDFDNDGFLDMYLGTGEPILSMLVPNRLFKNVGGKRFAEITAATGTGHLQKGHGVACGDWDRDGNVDIFIQTGGTVPGDRYHNLLFQNPGQGNHWLTVKLIGKKTNRPAIGARIKAVTAGATPFTVHRHVSSGSSFGANPLQQTIGLAKADRVARLEIYWPTSGTTQIFHDIPADQAIEITEFAADYRQLDWTPIRAPK